jgi:hypothetical protein
MRRPDIVFLLATAALVFAGCGTAPPETEPPGNGFVAAELAALAPQGEYDYRVVGFEDAQETRRGVSSGGVEFRSLTANIGFEIGRRITGDDAPPEARFVGTPEHVRLNGAGTIVLPRPETVLGMHIVLPAEQARLHRRLVSRSETLLRVTGFTSGGRESASVRISPAYATPAATHLETEWLWVDLSVLGEVTQLELSFESPLAELPVLLVDNVTLSPDFVPSGDYFTIAAIPSAVHREEARDILNAQVSFIAARGPRTPESILYASLLGALVPDGSDDEAEEAWELADTTFAALDRRVPWGTALAPGDLEDPEDPEEGSELYLEYFDEERFEGRIWWRGTSDDGYSSFQIVDTPVGEVLFLQLETDPLPVVMEWAGEVLNRYRDLPAVLSTASYLGPRGRHDAPLLGWDPDGEVFGASAEQIWNELVWPNTHVFLVLCAPPPEEESIVSLVQLSRNRDEKPVIEMMTGTPPWGSDAGYLRLLRFYPQRNEMRALTYSPLSNTYDVAVETHFRIPLDISGRVGLD